MKTLVSAARRFFADEAGATMVEYGLMLGLITAASIAAVTALGTAISGKFTSVAGSI